MELLLIIKGIKMQNWPCDHSNLTSWKFCVEKKPDFVMFSFLLVC